MYLLSVPCVTVIPGLGADDPCGVAEGGGCGVLGSGVAHILQLVSIGLFNVPHFGQTLRFLSPSPYDCDLSGLFPLRSANLSPLCYNLEPHIQDVCSEVLKLIVKINEIANCGFNAGGTTLSRCCPFQCTYLHSKLCIEFPNVSV